MVSTFQADVHIIGVDEHCQKSYRGSVELGSTAVALGLPVDQPSLLSVEFSGHSFLTRGSASANYTTLFTPRAGYQYDMDVEYADAMYSVTLYERGLHGGARHKVERRPFSACIQQ